VLPKPIPELREEREGVVAENLAADAQGVLIL
jgi:hypothetical protein